VIDGWFALVVRVFVDPPARQAQHPRFDVALGNEVRDPLNALTLGDEAFMERHHAVRGRPLVDDLGVVGNHEDLPSPPIDHVRRSHQPGLDFPQGDEVFRLINDDLTAFGQDEVEDDVQADEASLSIG
jgi:hypothetical protein